MKKEQILKDFKALILELRDNSEKLKEDEAYRKEWLKRQALLIQGIQSLNSCDAVWLNDEYGKWFNVEIKPFADKLDSELKKTIS